MKEASSPSNAVISEYDGTASGNPHQVGDQSEAEAFLGSREAYGLAQGAVERIDTHAAVVFLAGNRAYKIKRAVKYPYLDFSTLAQREAACRHEVELNRRTAPEIYLGVCAVRRSARGGLYLERGKTNGSLDPVVEWAVEMRRFDRENMLDRLAERGALQDGLLEDLARAIASFHAAAAPSENDDDPVKSFIDIVRGNDLAYDEYKGLFPREASLAFTRKSLAWIEDHRGVISARASEGKIRHCHGDLHLANIVMLGACPRLFDAIEFDDRIATIDVFYDLAFLLMDLWERDCHHAANVVFNRYLAVTEDYGALPLLPLFLATRAAIRAKVSAAQGRRQDAQKYFRYAVGFLTPARAVCIAIGGLSGSGKTSAARVLAPSTGSAPGAVHLRSDLVRKAMFGAADSERLPSSCYDRQTSERVYDTVYRQARQVLEGGHSVIVDAVFSAPNERRAVEEIAEALGVQMKGIWLTAPKPLLKRRVAERKHDASDATPDVVEQQSHYDLGPMTWRRIDNEGPIEALADQLLKDVAERPGA